MSAPELPYSDGPYCEMFARAAAEWRERNRFGQLRDQGRSRSSIMTKADLQKQLDYLSGWPEMQSDAIQAFKERQVERDAEMARRVRRNGQGKRTARAFMQERREYLKTRAKRARR